MQTNPACEEKLSKCIKKQTLFNNCKFVSSSGIIVQQKMKHHIRHRDVEAVIFQTLPLLLSHLSLPLPLPLTKSEKTTVDNFFNFCGSVACLLLHLIILRRQKPSFIAITLPTALKLIVPNYSVFLVFRY